MRLDEETEHTCEEGTGGQKDMESIGDMERTNGTSVAFRNQEEEQTQTEPTTYQNSVVSPNPALITANDKNAVNSQPGTSVMINLCSQLRRTVL